MTGAVREAAAGGALRLASLAAALAIMLGVTVHPGLLADGRGGADHLATLALCWAMSAGFVSGVGFRPLHPLPRLLLSGWAVLAGLLAALLRLGA